MKKILLVITLLIAAYATYSFSRTGARQNFAAILGVPLQKEEIVFEANPDNAIYDEHFIKAEVTSSKAKKIHKQLLAKGESRFFAMPLTLQDMTIVEGESQWSPRQVKKYLSGTFDAKVGQDVYYCKYIIDIGKSDKSTVYLYAIYSAQ